MQGFDFDPEAVVRFVWHGVPLIHLPTPVRYLSHAEGGISHFKYLRDNVLLTGMHLRLGLTAIVRLLRIARLRGTSVRRAKRAAQTLGATDNNAV